MGILDLDLLALHLSVIPRNEGSLPQDRRRRDSSIPSE
jgi:hypothetical protein